MRRMKHLYTPGGRNHRSAAAGVLFFYSLIGACIWIGGTQQARAQYKEIHVTNGGTIRGTVTLNGDPGKAVPLEVTQNNATCGRSKEPQLTLGKNRGVANTFIYIDSIGEGKSFQRLPSYALHQHRCEYSPHALVIPLGASLEIVNDDPILHNVHTYLDGKPPKTLFNIAQPLKGIRMKTRPMDQPGLVLATCDAGHPWMLAHIMVARHPYYAITDANGNFRLENVPPGRYTLKLWHEGIAIVNKIVQKGKVTRYEFEAPYEERRSAAVSPHEETVVDFDLLLR
jgi:hypothetical protein